MTPRPAIDASALFATRDLLRQANRKCTVQDAVTSVPKSDASATKSRPDFARIVTQSLHRVGDKLVAHKNENNIRVSFLELFDSASHADETRLVWHIRRLKRGEYITSGALTIARFECEDIGPVYRLYRDGYELHTEAYTHNMKGRLIRAARKALSRGWSIASMRKVCGPADSDDLDITYDELVEAGAVVRAVV